MKLMTYNLLNGGEGNLQLITKIIKKESPDFLTINEANTFAKDNNKILTELASKTGFPYYEIALSGEDDYHTVVLSKYPFKYTSKIKSLIRAGILSIINTNLGELCIVGTHLSPLTEDLRLSEIDLIIKLQKKYKNHILMGDINSLAYYDNYNSEIVKSFNKTQLKKFTTNGKLRFDVIKKILSHGYYDTALEFNKNKDANRCLSALLQPDVGQPTKRRLLGP